ncbi:MAG TPA: hypothetical protein VJ952_06275, partial [Opitutales bacterium]|nr:hypothetical protein [Opitutales bacterium]
MMASERKKEGPGIVSFLLHAHLPYGAGFERQTALEQAWLYEAVTDCYLPLLSLIGHLEDRRAPWLTISLSPTLLELWGHPEFPERYRTHLERGLRVIHSESNNPRHPEERRRLAPYLGSRWKQARERFDSIAGKLPAAFGRLAESGKIELITTAATHPFLPAFQNDPRFRNFQIGNGIETFKAHTGISPKGFWLPECAYFDGLEKDLARFGIEYFGLETLGLTRATPGASIRQPLACPNGLLALGRDNQLSQKV